MVTGLGNLDGPGGLTFGFGFGGGYIEIRMSCNLKNSQGPQM